MPLLTMVFVLVIVGVVLYLVNTYAPMDAKIKTILNWAVVIAVIVWLASIFGLLTSLSMIHIGRGL